MKVWFITNESPHSADEELGCSLIGLFSTKEKALEYLRVEVIGDDEKFNGIEWVGSEYNPNFFDGFGADGQIYILSTEEID